MLRISHSVLSETHIHVHLYLPRSHVIFTTTLRHGYCDHFSAENLGCRGAEDARWDHGLNRESPHGSRQERGLKAVREAKPEVSDIAAANLCFQVAKRQESNRTRPRFWTVSGGLGSAQR